MDDIIVEFERIIGPPKSTKFSCEEHDHFWDDSITDSQLLRCVEAPTQGGIPEGLAQSPEDEIHPPSSEAMEGIESQKSAPEGDGQDIIGEGDLEDSFPEQELPLGQGHS